MKTNLQQLEQLVDPVAWSTMTIEQRNNLLERFQQLMVEVVALPPNQYLGGPPVPTGGSDAP